MAADWISALGMVATATLVAMACLCFLVALQMLWSRHAGSIFTAAPTETAFLFEGDRLLDATPSARALLASEDGAGTLGQMLARLGPMFPDLGARLTALPNLGQITLASGPTVTPPVVLRGEYLAGLTRLTVVDADTASRQDGQGSAIAAAQQQEIGLQREVLQHAPVLIWREDPAGGVSWANHAYLIRAVELLPPAEELSWPLPRIFSLPGEVSSVPMRVKLQMRGGAEWFDLMQRPMGQDVICYAVPANAAVRAETTLREFMQTLTKTFADLPIGLAIFDRARVLQLFNPALADLTTLAPEFLISRPTLNAMLDALRAKAMLPEPKDYRSWRLRLTKVEEEAAQGLFEETWSLPGGQTYRVIGRPHPNGALAFMFEDISSEMIRTRRYRADLELGQAVIDALDEAVAVFSQGGQLVMSNLAYARLWQHDPAVLLSDAGISTLCAWWREHSAPSLLWEDAREFLAAAGDRTAWEGEARLLDGRLVNCRFRPLTGGATLIAFRPIMADPVALRPEILAPRLLSA